MDIKSSLEIFNFLEADNLCFAYSGSISDTITHKIIELTQFNIDSSGNFVKLKNKISFLLAECYQNVVRHGKVEIETASFHEKSSAFFVRSIGSSFFITSANIVNNSTIDVVKEKLDRVNSLSPDELRLLQKQVLAKGKLSERGGAGLGIIEMARKSGKKIIYDFEPISDCSSMFYLQLMLSSAEDSSKQEDDDYQNSSLGIMKSLHKLMVKEDILILHKGDFAEHSVLPVIQMIEKNLHKENETHSGRQKLYNISVELLQNISMHAFRKNGTNDALFILGKQDDDFYISTTNFIENNKVENLTTQLNNLKKLTKEELNGLYRQKLQSIIDRNETGLGIGLIYIFRKCNSVDFVFKPNEELIGLFNLVVTISM
ncbi:MAG TPA: SiaB family protein kinase [Tenuifilaceae bacterium]|nr:SiaB family protein kinase [Tenuifilaceae bacterium]HPE17191.1 SiaB family protein kinase [Tenuifilaceae bacterium]HPJ44761.1 SiaB family protein kinase [Tenuifilaceae bacterium]HPQ33303.1 SiaB family protein kinase [Tenuifilaceae bacterium]HRX67590.1 SiaB family protein kinase [Tenuifilaceae bacterium]